MKLITDGELTQKDQSDLDRLFRGAFGGMCFEDTPKADLRAIIRRDGMIIAHVGIQNRLIEMPSYGSLPMAFVGQVVVTEQERGRRLGLVLIQGLMKRNAKSFILNCGERLTGYYEKIGFYVASDAALYVRNSIEVIDEDPVMIHNNGCFVHDIHCETPIPLGRDF